MWPFETPLRLGPKETLENTRRTTASTILTAMLRVYKLATPGLARRRGAPPTAAAPLCPSRHPVRAAAAQQASSVSADHPDTAILPVQKQWINFVLSVNSGSARVAAAPPVEPAGKTPRRR